MDNAGAVLVATVDITPTDLESVRTAGYSDQLPAPHAVDQPLEANVLGLVGGSLDEPLYVVSVDSLYGGALSAELARQIGCPRDNVRVLASHTHFAPATDPGLPRMGHTSDEYVRRIAAQIARAIAAAPWRKHARVRIGTSEVPPHLFINRRRPILGIGLRLGNLGTVVTAPEPTGAVDRTLRFFELSTGHGEVIAIGWGAACHPVCSPDRHAVSSDFPGAVREQLRPPGSGLPVLFFQGCSGDVRPASTSRRPPLSPRGLLRYLLAGLRTFTPQTQSAYDAWCSALAASAVGAWEACGETFEVRPRRRGVTTQDTGQWHRRPELGLVGIADEVALLTVNAELMSVRAADLPPVGSPSMIIPATCADEVIGYWPTSAILAEGGYEGCRSRPFFPPVDWEHVDPDALWDTMLAQALKHSPPGADPTRPMG